MQNYSVYCLLIFALGRDLIRFSKVYKKVLPFNINCVKMPYLFRASFKEMIEEIISKLLKSDSKNASLWIIGYH